MTRAPRGVFVAIGLALVSVVLLWLPRTAGPAWLWPALACVTSFVAVMVAQRTMFRRNVLALRAAMGLAVLTHGVVVGLASGSWLVGLAALLASSSAIGATETFIGSLGYDSMLVGMVLFPVALGAFAIGSGMALTSGAPGSAWWGLAAVPSLLQAGQLAWRMGGSTLRRRKMARARWNVAVGDPVPDFELPTRTGAPGLELSGARGQNLLIVFIRGDWCPVCQIQLRLFQRESELLKRHDVKLVAISPSGGEDADAFARSLGVDYLLLHDPDARVAELFGALDTTTVPGERVILPSAFLVGRDGRLLFTSRPDHIGEALDRAALLHALETSSDASRRADVVTA